MVAPSYRIEGASKILKDLDSFSESVKDLKVAHKGAAEVVAKDAQPRSRRLSGRMAGSIRSTGQKKQGVVRIGFAALPWVPVQYFGNPKHNISPAPILSEAAEAKESQVYDTYESHLNEQLRKIGLA